MRRTTNFIILLTLAFALLIVFIQSSAQHTGDNEPSRADFRLPKLFDFVNFKQIFKKSYNSLIEEAARQRIFLARAFDVFIAAVWYKHRKSSSYLGINHLSDLTPAEISRMFMRPGKLKEGTDKASIGKKPLSDEDSLEIPAADADDIEREFADIRRHAKNHEPAYEMIAKELNNRLIHKRDLTERELSLDELIVEPKTLTESIVKVPSNNPNYEEPELISYGLENTAEEQTAPLSEKLTGLVKNLPGSNYLSNAFKLASNYFFVNDENESLPGNKLYVDHRRSGCIHEPRNQGNFCGSCYAFAAVALYEWFYCMLTGKKVAFSEQYIVDCGPDRYSLLEGCEKGSFTQAMKFMELYGIELRSNYPYKSKKGHCPYKPEVAPHSMGYLRVRSGGWRDVTLDNVNKVLGQAPMIVNIYTNQWFPFYLGGVDKAYNCDTASSLHSVLLVGHGITDGEEYWLIKNSFGSWWGQRGYYKLSKSARDCIDEGVATGLRSFTLPGGSEIRVIYW